MRSLGVLILLSATAVYGQAHRPTLKETLEWMHSSYPDSQSMTAFNFKQTRELNYAEGKDDASPSCTITLVEHWKADGNPVTRNTVIDLSLIDPESIKSYKDDTVEKDAGVLTLVTTNDKKVISETTDVPNKKDDKPNMVNREFINFIGTDYAERFTKALKNAVSLCGGKPSAF